MSQFEDVNLECSLVASLSDLSTYDIREAKRFLESSIVGEEDFTRRSNWIAYQAVASCIRSNIPSTADNILRESARFAEGTGVESVRIVTGPDSAGSGHGLSGYAERLMEITERRKQKRLLESAIQKLSNPSISSSEVRFNLVGSLQRTRGRIQTKGLDEYAEQVESHLDDVMAGRVKPVIPWFIPRLDDAIGGLQPTLIMIGAEPGVGKSALLASAVNLQANNGHRPLIASLEDEPSWLAWRLVSNSTQKNQFDMRFKKMSTGELSFVKQSNEQQKKIRSHIRVIDGSNGGVKIEDLISSIDDAIVNEGCDSVWIDHAGEIVLSSTERTDLEISRHLSLLRGIANRHSVPVVVAAHFKRCEDPSKPPSFRDFANSSGSERKARIALGLRRNPGSDSLAVHVMKQTNGPAGMVVDLNFNGAAAMILANEDGWNGLRGAK